MTDGIQNPPASNPFALTALTEPSAQLTARLQARQTNRTGLKLTEAQSIMLADANRLSLQAAGRIEFGMSAVERLNEAFCDSPYLTAETYADTLAELTALFYGFKNDARDAVSDEQLVGWMKRMFDGPCAGSAELLADAFAEKLAEARR